jgi:hypothetical protein
LDVSGTDIKYAFVGNPETQCPPPPAVIPLLPNGNVGADVMSFILCHELAEAITDPDGGAWTEGGEGEIGDFCEPGKASRGYETLGARTYFLQPLMSNVGGLPGQCVFAL